MAAKCIDKDYLKEDGGYVFFFFYFYIVQQAFFTEIALMEKLNHEKIINLYEVYEGEKTFYMILEYLRGKSLHDIVSKS